MVKVIKLTAGKERTRCEYCSAVLEFTRKKDVKRGEKPYATDFMIDSRVFEYIRCPVCGNRTEV